MRISISNDVIKKYPGLNIGIVIARNINNKGSDEKIYHLLEQVEKLVKLNFIPESLAKHPLISPWKTAYLEFNAQPKTEHSYVEALMRKIMSGSKIPRSNKLVDVYNYVSLKYTVPIGSDDLDKIEGNISLKAASGKEKFIPLGRSKHEKLEKGEIIYADFKRALCSKWNWREAEHSKITKDTKNAILFIDGLPPLTVEKVREITDDMKELVEMFCGGEVEYFILNKEFPDKFVK